MIEVSLEDARNFVLDAQGLRTESPSMSIMDVAERIHNIQIDTISVVSRSHNLITFNRYSDYKEGEIWKTLREGKLLEYWSHSACLMPMESYPFYAWRCSFYPEELWTSFRKWAAENKGVIDEVYKKVQRDGATNSASVGERTTKSGGWWDWKIEKRALEYLYTTGKLAVAYRVGFQKHYDLVERVIPSGIDTEPLSNDEAADFVVETTLKSLGLASYRDVRTYLGMLPARKIWGGKKKDVEDFLFQKVAAGVLEQVSIEGIRDTYFALQKNVSFLENPHFNDTDVPVKILSPFDNLIRERHYPQQLWDFEYAIECYTPAPKRVYGYFVLPILDGSSLSGRMDAKVHRKTEELEIKALYLETDDLKSSTGLERLHQGVSTFAKFHSCNTVKVRKVSPRSMTKQIRSQLDIVPI